MSAERAKPTALQRAVTRFRGETRMRGGYPCNYPACGCDWDAVCDDAIAASNPPALALRGASTETEGH